MPCMNTSSCIVCCDREVLCRASSSMLRVMCDDVRACDDDDHRRDDFVMRVKFFYCSLVSRWHTERVHKRA